MCTEAVVADDPHFWRLLIDAQRQRPVRGPVIKKALLDAYNSINSNRSGAHYLPRKRALHEIDRFYGTNLFGCAPDPSSRDFGEVGIGYGCERFSEMSHTEVETFLAANLNCVSEYVQSLNIGFNQLLDACVRYDSIYMSEVSNHRKVADHDFYFRNSADLPPLEKFVPDCCDEKILTFVIAIKGRNKRTNIAVRNIYEASGPYFRFVDIVLVEDYSADPFVNETGIDVRHYVTGHHTSTGIWSKSILLNEGMARSRSKYVVMSDCDFLYRDLTKLVEVAYSCRKADDLMFHISLHETHQTTFLQENNEIVRPKFFPYSYVWIFNKDRALEINGFNELFTGWGYEETDLIRRILSQQSRLAFVNDCRAYHLSHSDSTRVRKNSNRSLFEKNILKPERVSDWKFDELDTKTGYLLASFQKHSGGEIDILGNGPSTAAYDFTRGSVKIGFNVAYRHWDKIGLYPDIYICMDKVVCAYHAPQIRRLVDSGRIGFFVLDDVFIGLFPEYASRRNVLTFSTFAKGKFKLFETKHVTTGSFGARLAVLLGFRKLNVWGMSGEYVDFIEESERVPLVESGLNIDSIFTSSTVTGDILRIVRTPERNPNYYFDGYQIEGDLYNIPSNPKIYRCSCDFHSGSLVDSSIHKYWWDLFRFDLGKLNIDVCVTKDGRDHSF
jgi:hypothetical protein